MTNREKFKDIRKRLLDSEQSVIDMFVDYIYDPPMLGKRIRASMRELETLSRQYNEIIDPSKPAKGLYYAYPSNAKVLVTDVQNGVITVKPYLSHDDNEQQQLTYEEWVYCEPEFSLILNVS